MTGDYVLVKRKVLEEAVKEVRVLRRLLLELQRGEAKREVAQAC